MKEPSQEAAQDILRLKKNALVFVWVGEIWNFLEEAVALWSGTGAGSVALVGFGLYSILELAAGAILIWRLQTEWHDHEEENTAERKAHMLVGIRFYICQLHLSSIRRNSPWLYSQPDESTVGLVLIVVSAVVMTILYFKKMAIAEKIGSRSL